MERKNLWKLGDNKAKFLSSRGSNKRKISRGPRKNSRKMPKVLKKTQSEAVSAKEKSGSRKPKRKLSEKKYPAKKKKCKMQREDKKLPERYEFVENVTKERGVIIDHLTKECLPLYMKLTAGEIFKLRKFSTVLRMHSSSKKDGEEELFAEMQSFSPWKPIDLVVWRNQKRCHDEYESRKKKINTLKKKTFAFSMNELIKEVKAH